MTSLATQLQRLALPQSELAVPDKDRERASLLFDPKEAANLDRDTFYALGVNGLDELANIDPVFLDFHNNLFSQSSKNLERVVQTKEVNARLDENISGFLTLVSPYFLLRPAQKALEWLINRFHIHRFNTDDLVACVLPYHQTKMFVRVVQLLKIEQPTNRWNWMAAIQKPGTPLARSTVINHCAADLGFLTFICDMVQKATKLHSSQDSSAPSPMRALVSFYATTILGALEVTETIKENMVTKLLPYVLKGLKSRAILDYKAGSYLIIGQLANKITMQGLLVRTFVKGIWNMIGSPVATSTPTGQAPKPPPRVKSQQKPLRAVVINFQSIRNKVSEFHVFCDTVKPDVIVGTESWLDPTVGNSEVFPTSYSAYRKDREGRGGGVFIAVKNSIIATHLPDPDCTSELTWVQIQLAHSKTVHIGAYYRPPSADQSDLTSLEQSLTRIRDQSRNSHIWLAGDFNLPTARWNTDTTSNSTSNLSNGAANKHIPRKKARKRHSQPWITPQIRRAMRKRDKFCHKAPGSPHSRPKEKAEALGEQFESVFTKEDTNIIPTLGEPSVPTTPELKHGFRKGLSCETQLLVTTHDLAHGLDQNLQIDAVVLDFSKAFDTVPHQRLLSKLQYYGIKGHILSWLKAFLTERTQTVVLDGESSKPSRVTSGVPQGTSPTDAQGLQADLDALTEWQDLHISNDMRWDAHIAHATGKANRTLGVIRRNLYHCTSQVKNTCYKALVRPQLEYCASVWDPYTAGGVQAVERVQRRAARMVMNDYARTSSVTEMLQKLQWPTLANRRREAPIPLTGLSFKLLCRVPGLVQTLARLTTAHDITGLLTVFLPQLVKAAVNDTVSTTTGTSSEGEDSTAGPVSYCGLLENLLLDVEPPESLQTLVAKTLFQDYLTVRSQMTGKSPSAVQSLNERAGPIVKLIDRRYPVAMDTILQIHMGQSAEEVSEVSHDAEHVQEFVSLSLGGLKHQLVPEAQTSLVLSLNHPNATVRKNAVKHLPKAWQSQQDLPTLPKEGLEDTLIPLLHRSGVSESAADVLTSEVLLRDNPTVHDKVAVAVLPLMFVVVPDAKSAEVTTAAMLARSYLCQEHPLLKGAQQGVVATCSNTRGDHVRTVCSNRQRTPARRKGLTIATTSHLSQSSDVNVVMATANQGLVSHLSGNLAAMEPDMRESMIQKLYEAATSSAEGCGNLPMVVSFILAHLIGQLDPGDQGALCQQALDLVCNRLHQVGSSEDGKPLRRVKGALDLQNLKFLHTKVAIMPQNLAIHYQKMSHQGLGPNSPHFVPVLLWLLNNIIVNLHDMNMFQHQGQACLWMVFSTKDSFSAPKTGLFVDGVQHEGQACLLLVFSTKDRPVFGWCSPPRTGLFVDGVQHQGQMVFSTKDRPVSGWCSAPRTGLLVDGVQHQGQACLWMAFSTKDKSVCGWCSAPRTAYSQQWWSQQTADPSQKSYLSLLVQLFDLLVTFTSGAKADHHVQHFRRLMQNFLKVSDPGARTGTPMKLLPLRPRRSASPPPRSASPPQKICFAPVVPLRPRRNSALPPSFCLAPNGGTAHSRHENHDFRVDCELCRHWGLSRRTGAKQNCAGGVEERRGRSRFFAGAKQNGAEAKQNGGGEEEGVHLPDTACLFRFLSMLWVSHRDDSHTRALVQVRSLHMAAVCINSSGDKAVSKLMGKESGVLPSLLVTLQHRVPAVREAALAVLEALLTQSDGSMYGEVLVKKLVHAREELVADNNHLKQALHVLFKPLEQPKLPVSKASPGKHKQKAEAKQAVLQATLDSLLGHVTAEDTPPHMKVGLLEALQLVNSQGVLCSLLPMLDALLEKCPHGLTPEEAAILHHILVRYQVPTAPLLQPYHQALQLFQKAMGICGKPCDGQESPQTMALRQITKDFFSSLPSPAVRQALLSTLFDLQVIAPNPQIAKEISHVLKVISLQAEEVAIELKKFTQSAPSTSVRGAKKMRRATLQAKVTQRSATDSEPWRRVTVILEMLQNKKKVRSLQLIVPPLFAILARCLEEEEQTPVEYLKQLVLTCLLNTCERLSPDNNPLPPDVLPEEQFNAELVVQCIQLSDSPQTHNQALLLLGTAAGLFPDKVLHQAMAIFTFMGAHVLRQDDTYSLQIITRTVDTVIPALIQASERNPSLTVANQKLDSIVAMVIRVFVDALPHIPEHRRQAVFHHLVRTVGGGQYLWTTLALVFESKVVGKTGGVHSDGEDK
ncbi:HEAT repeat-containing protein 1, partial [Branchiostoma belcheri]